MALNPCVKLTLFWPSFCDLMHEVLLEHVYGGWSFPGPGLDTHEFILPPSVVPNLKLPDSLP